MLNKLFSWATRDLAGAEDMVRIYRRRAKRSAARELGLTMALNQLALRQAEAGMREEALDTLEEAVAICRRRAVGEPSRFEPYLAMALHNQGSFLMDGGQFEEALPAAEEAVAVYRRLAARRPRPYEQEVELSVENRDIALSQLTRQVADQAESGHVIGPYPLCDECKKVNGGLVAVRHRQVHISANGRQSCVDEGLADVVTALWQADCDTTSACQDEYGNGRAYVYVVCDDVVAAQRCLTGLGLTVEKEACALYFHLPVTGR
ncbi:tetratricopeptide repeat protein [Actinophytocola sp.]|uniref:tetratricopeptide repeat protein n=1 Tax=Actinophytocola sp. TaxID=1872138 RepID=UPI002ED5492A